MKYWNFSFFLFSDFFYELCEREKKKSNRDLFKALVWNFYFNTPYDFTMNAENLSWEGSLSSDSFIFALEEAEHAASRVSWTVWFLEILDFRFEAFERNRLWDFAPVAGVASPDLKIWHCCNISCYWWIVLASLTLITTHVYRPFPMTRYL